MSDLASRFLDMVERSVFVQAVSTLSVLGSVLYLYITGQEVPDPLLQLTWALLGIFIGGKINQATNTHYESRQ